MKNHFLTLSNFLRRKTWLAMLPAAVFAWAVWMTQAVAQSPTEQPLAAQEKPEPAKQESAPSPANESAAKETAATDAKNADETPYPPLTEKRFYEVLLADIALQRQEPVLATRTFLQLAKDTQSSWFAQRAAEGALAGRDKTLLDQALEMWQKLDPDNDRPLRLKAHVARTWQHPMGQTSDEGEIREVRARFESLLREAAANEKLDEVFLQLNAAFAQWPDKVAVFNIIRALALPYPQQPEAHYAVALAALMVTIDKAAEKKEGASSKIFQEGLQEIDQVLESVPQWSEALQIKAALLERTSPEKLMLWLQETVQKTPDEKSLWPLLARAYVQQKQYSEAREWFLKVWKDSGADTALMAAGALSIKLNDQASAQQLLDEVGKKENVEKVNAVRIMYARIAEDEKRPLEAIAWYRQVDGGDDLWRVQIHLAALLAQNGKRDEALALLTELPAVTIEERISVLQLRAHILRDGDDWKGARDVLEKGVAEFSESVDLLMDLGLVEEKLGHLKKAEEHLRAALKQKPDEPFVQNALGYTLVDHKLNVEEGAALIEKAHQAIPDDGAILDSMGWARYRQGKMEEAVPFLQQAWEKQPDAEVAAHWGEVLWQLKRFDEARKVWALGMDKAADKETNDVTIRETMKRLGVPKAEGTSTTATP